MAVPGVVGTLPLPARPGLGEVRYGPQWPRCRRCLPRAGPRRAGRGGSGRGAAAAGPGERITAGCRGYPLPAGGPQPGPGGGARPALPPSLPPRRGRCHPAPPLGAARALPVPSRRTAPVPGRAGAERARGGCREQRCRGWALPAPWPGPGSAARPAAQPGQRCCLKWLSPPGAGHGGDLGPQRRLPALIRRCWRRPGSAGWSRDTGEAGAARPRGVVLGQRAPGVPVRRDVEIDKGHRGGERPDGGKELRVLTAQGRWRG